MTRDDCLPAGDIMPQDVQSVGFIVPAEYRTTEVQSTLFLIVWVWFPSEERACPIMFYRGQRTNLRGYYDPDCHVYVFSPIHEHLPEDSIFICYALIEQSILFEVTEEEIDLEGLRIDVMQDYGVHHHTRLVGCDVYSDQQDDFEKVDFYEEYSTEELRMLAENEYSPTEDDEYDMFELADEDEDEIENQKKI
jgi:hypothetical protein